MALNIVGNTYTLEKKTLLSAGEEAFLFLAENFEANLKFVSETEMTRLNSEFRDISKPTDVLSFKLADGENGGDIAICLGVVKKEALEWQMTLTDAVCWLLVHGTLHLAGYDHETTSDRVKMEAAEEQILEKLGIKLNRG